MKEKRERKKWGLILFIVLIMIGTSFSFVFFGFSPVTEKVKYNKISFVNNGNIWIARIDGKEAAFSFLPKDVESISASEDISGRLRNKFEIDATYDLNNTYKESIALAQHQMGLTLAAYGIFVRKGFTTDNTFNLPVITCNDATANVPVVYFKHGNSTNIKLNNNCIIAEASKNEDFIKAKDRLLYGILGVMK